MAEPGRFSRLPLGLRYLAALLLILCVSAAAFGIFVSNVVRYSTEDKKEQLSEITQIVSDSLRSRFDMYLNFIELLASQVGSVGAADTSAALEIMRGAVRETGFDIMNVTYADGRSFAVNETASVKSVPILVSAPRIFAKTVEGKRYIAFSTPVIRADGRFIASLSGLLSVGAIDDLSYLHTFSGEGRIIFVDTNGEYIFGHNDSDNIIDTSVNFLESIQLVGMADSTSLESVLNNFSRRASFSFTYDAGEAGRRIAVLSPLGIADWFVGIILPAQFISDRTNAVQRAAIALLLEMGLIFSLLTLFVISREHISAKEAGKLNRAADEVISNIPGGVQKCAADDTFTSEYVSPGFAEMLGCASADEASAMFGGSFLNSVCGEEREKTKDSILAQLAESGQFSVVYRMRKKDGSMLKVISKGGRIADENGVESIYCVTVDATKSYETVDNLRNSEERFKIAISQANVYVVEYDWAEDTIINSDSLCEKWGLAKTIQNFSQFVRERRNHSAGYSEAARGFADMIQWLSLGCIGPCDTSFYRVMADGSLRYIEAHFSAVRDDNGALIKVIGVLPDMTAQKEAEVKYLRSEQYRKTIAALYDRSYEIDVTNDRVISDMSAMQFMDGLPQNTPATVFMSRLAAIMHPDDLKAYREYTSLEALKAVYDVGVTESDLEYRIMADDDYVWRTAHISLFRSPADGTLHGMVFVKDITSDIEQRDALRGKAERDPLTGLLNKLRTEEIIKETLAADARSDELRINALIIIDLDNFKSINDLMGHLFGDAVLADTGKRLTSVFRSTDVVGRTGGDEFIVFMKNIPNRTIAMSKAALACSEIMSAPDEGCCAVSASVGIAFSPDDGRSFEELYMKADMAMYRAKDAGKGRCLVYSADMGEVFRRAKKNAAIDSRPAIDETFAFNPPRHIFRILKNAKDSAVSARLVIELIVRHYDFARGYIFELSEDLATSTETFEWCADGVESHIDGFQNLRIGTDTPDMMPFYGDDGVFSTIGVAEDDVEFTKTVPGEQTAGIIHFLIGTRSEPIGYIGFDCRDEKRTFSPREYSDILSCGHVITSYLSKRIADRRVSEKSKALGAELASSSSFFYVVDPESWEIEDSNISGEKVPSGKKCYKIFADDADAPCADCVVKRFIESGGCGFDKAGAGDIRYRAEVTRADWYPEARYMVFCREIRGD